MSLRFSVPPRQLSERLSRPPWHVATTAEVADAAEIPFGRLSNWIVRGQFIAAEPRGLFWLNGNQRVYRIDRVVEWLTGVDVEEQAVGYLTSIGLAIKQDDIWERVRCLESLGVFPHVWEPRDRAAFVAGLR